MYFVLWTRFPYFLVFFIVPRPLPDFWYLFGMGVVCVGRYDKCQPFFCSSALLNVCENVPTHSLPFLELFALAREGWQKRHGGQYMNWCTGTKKLASVFAPMDTSRLHGWDPRDDGCCWLETLTDVSQNRRHWRIYCKAYLQNPFPPR